MSAVGLLVLATAAAAAGVGLVVSGWSRVPRDLLRVVAHQRRSGDVDDRRTRARWSPEAVGADVLRALGGAPAERWRQPLRLVDRSAEMHLGLLLGVAIIGFSIPVVVSVGLVAAGVVSIGPALPGAVALGAAVAAPAVVHATTLARSQDVRTDLRLQLSGYLDMVTMLLAGNTGHEGALDQAARAGDGLLFVELRRRIREVGTQGESLVNALELVARDYGLVELEQVAATARLSAGEGAPVARTLAAKCATLRSTLATAEEADARVRSDKLTPPLVGMALLFMALIIYPALTLN